MQQVGLHKRTLTFVTYNILNGGAGREAWIREALVEQNADVVLLQEVIDEACVRHWAKELDAELFVAHGKGKFSLALLTRLPLKQFTSAHPPPLRHPLFHATLEDGTGETLDLFGLHLAAPAFNLPLEIYRLRELNVVLKWVDAARAARVVIGGDFNAIAPGDRPGFKHLPYWLRFSIFAHGGYVARQVIGRMNAAGYLDAYRLIHPHEPGYTLPAFRPNSRLDYFFVNRALSGSVRGCEVVTSPPCAARASDHLPVQMELEVDGGRKTDDEGRMKNNLSSFVLCPSSVFGD